MIVASFLTKDLLVDWRWGEQFFMQHLIDGDPAANNGGWQWTAGTGTDAAPYFRVFNPILQSLKFDPDGTYIRRYVPELANVPLDFIHSPWTMPLHVQKQVGCLVGKRISCSDHRPRGCSPAPAAGLQGINVTIHRRLPDLVKIRRYP